MKLLVKKMKLELLCMDAGDKAILVEVGLAVIAVVLLVVFQNQMTPLVTDVVTSMKAKMQSILSTVG